MSKEIEIPESADDLDLDLDALLAEGMLIKQAQRNKALGRKNRPEELEALKAAAIVHAMDLWIPGPTFAVFEQERWLIPCHHPEPVRFLGFYQHSTSRRSNAQRLLRLDGREGIPPVAGKFTKIGPFAHCPHCLLEGIAVEEVEDGPAFSLLKEI